jgi:hypothetical protein
VHDQGAAEHGGGVDGGLRRHGEGTRLLRDAGEGGVEPIRLSINMDKLELLIPSEAPPPAEGVFPKEVQITRVGIKVAGAPVGTEEYVEGFLQPSCRIWGR